MSNNYEINDKRKQKEFNGISFSTFKKTEVKKQFLKSILDGKTESANYWCAELICAGHFLDVWDMIILIMGKHIHYGNPKLPIYIDIRIDNFKDIVSNGYIDNEIKMRNSNKIREIFCEIICILCFSQKKHSYDTIKIKKDDYDLTDCKYRLKADNVGYVKDVFKTGDPKELFIAFNEFMYCISSKGTNMTNACYWMEWISEYETICKKQKELCICSRRIFMPVDSKKQMDVIWLLWEGIIYEGKTRNKLVSKIINSLLNIFCIRYTNGVKKRRRYIIYFAIALLTEKINMDVKIHNDDNVLNSMKKNIFKIYKQVKDNEIKPDTEYLFNGLNEKNTIEKTIAKMDIVNKMDFLKFVNKN